MSDDDPEESREENLTVDADSIAPRRAPTGRRPVPCPHCDTPVALVVSYGPTTHEASPCGCPVSGSLLEGRGRRSDAGSEDDRERN